MNFEALGLPSPDPFHWRINRPVPKQQAKRGPKKQGKAITLPGSSPEREIALLRPRKGGIDLAQMTQAYKDRNAAIRAKKIPNGKDK